MAACPVGIPDWANCQLLGQTEYQAAISQQSEENACFRPFSAFQVSKANCQSGKVTDSRDMPLSTRSGRSPPRKCLNLGRPDCFTNFWFMLRENAYTRTSRHDNPLTVLLGVAEARVFFLHPAAIEDLKDGIT